LQLEQLLIGAGGGDQLVVAAPLGDPAVLQHDDLVGVANLADPCAENPDSRC
jgi:hypothetical protein